MSRLMARIMLAVFMLPVSMLFYIFAFAVLYNSVMNRRETPCLLVTGLATAAFVGVYWVLLWRRSVRWTRPRVLGSIGIALGAVAVGAAAGWGMNIVEDDLVEFIFGPVITFAWLLGTVFVWRETKHERASRLESSSGTSVVCPACGYNLTGLRGTTCPECGASYTVDELFASQGGREDVEIDAAIAA